MDLKKRFGQHFLKDENYLRRMAEVVKSNDIILEIGPGGGALTKHLVKAKRVIAIEKDRRFAQLNRELEFKNLEVIEGDFLNINLDNLGATKVVANIPYYITTPIIKKLLLADGIEEIFLTIQKEVAERIVAKPSTKSYGLLTLLIKYYGNAKVIFNIPKGAFNPPPKVESSFIHISKKKKYIFEFEKFFKCAKLLFGTRRKTILKNLSGTYEREKVVEALDHLKLDQNLRAENLTLEEIAKISEAIF